MLSPVRPKHAVITYSFRTVAVAVAVAVHMATAANPSMVHGRKLMLSCPFMPACFRLTDTGLPGHEENPPRHRLDRTTFRPQLRCFHCFQRRRDVGTPPNKQSKNLAPWQASLATLPDH